MEWSTESIEKVICFVQENLMQETCAIFLTVCHHH